RPRGAGQVPHQLKKKRGTHARAPGNRKVLVAYFAAGDGLAFGAGDAAGATFFVVCVLCALFLVAGFFASVEVAAGLGLASGAGLAAFVVFAVFAGVSAKATIGIAAQARSSISFFIKLCSPPQGHSEDRQPPCHLGRRTHSRQ